MDQLLSIDMFTQKVGFTIGGRDSHPTVIGLIISLMVLISSAYIVSPSFLDWINQTNPVIINEKRINDQFEVKLSNDYDFSIQTLNPVFLKFETLNFDCPNLNTITIVDNSLFSYSSTEMKKKGGDICVFPYSTVSKTNYTESNSVIQLLKFTDDIIQVLLTDAKDSLMFIRLASPQITLSVNDPDVIIKKESNQFRLPISQNESKIYRINIMRETYTISGSQFFNNQRHGTYNYFVPQSAEYLGSIAKKDGLPYTSIVVQYDHSLNLIRINYLNEQDIISIIGGILGLMVMLGSAIDSFFARLSLEAVIINQFYNISKKIPKSPQKTMKETCHLSKLRLFDENHQMHQISALDILKSKLSFSNPFSKKHNTQNRIVALMIRNLNYYSDFIKVIKQQEILKRLIFLLSGSDGLIGLLQDQSIVLNCSSSLVMLDHSIKEYNMKSSINDQNEIPDYLKRNISSLTSKYFPKT